MIWECADDCTEKEQQGSQMSACHHCGKLVCRKHRQMIEDDGVRDVPGQPRSRKAVHCADCKKAFHPRVREYDAIGGVMSGTTP